jgi:lysophospholipase L1-like esterase
VKADAEPRPGRVHGQRARRLAAIGGAALPTLLFAAILAEVLVRLIALPAAIEQATYARDSANPGLYELDAGAGYTMVPSYRGRLHGADFDQSFETNSQGLRGNEVSVKQPGEFRIVVLGDSFVLGAEVPVEQRFSDRLEVDLKQHGYGAVRVISVGTRGWGTYNEAGFLRENISWLQPDLVVLCVFIGNISENVFATAAGYQLRGNTVAYGSPAATLEGDSVTWFDHNFRLGAAEYVQPSLPSNEWNQADGLPLPRGNADPSTSMDVDDPVRYMPGSAVDAMRTWLRNDSVLYHGAADAWFRLRYGYQRPAPLMLDNWLAFTLRDGPRQYWYEVAQPLTAQYVSQASAIAASVRAPLIAVIIPRDAQVDDAKLRVLMDRYRLLPDELDIDKPQRELLAATARLGLPVVDLEPIIRARPDSAQLFFPHDLHLTPAGHEVVAGAVADELEHTRLVPRSSGSELDNT